MPGLDLRLGIDVGGTNTDAVVLDRQNRLLAKAKVPGTSDVTGGVEAAIDAVLSALGIDLHRITHVMLGTTHATNAVLERRKLERVAVVRIGSPATHGVRPLFGWPADLRDAVSAGESIIGGGIEFDGRELAPFDADGLARFLGSLKSRPDGIAVTSVFATVSSRHELMAQEVIRHELGDVPVSLSHQIGSVGLLARENATVLNAALSGVAREVTAGVRACLEARGMSPATFFAQNDGSLMLLDYAIRFPVLTIGSGPANSIRGAALLTGIKDALVMDVGGTSTDVGMLTNGFPRESSQGVEIGGVRTNFRMPDLVTVAVGGGTKVGGSPSSVRLGPESVGYRIEQEALVFGGATLTLSDAAVLVGRAALGDRTPAPSYHSLAVAALAEADSVLADAVDRVKTSRGDYPLVLVGGGSLLLSEEIPGVSEIQRPAHFDVANAIGAAIASVSGQVDRVVDLGQTTRDQAIRRAGEEAMDQAVLAGADPAAVEVVEVEEIPLAYVTTPTERLRVKAVGPLEGLW